MAESNNNRIVEIRGLSKTFPGVKALSNVDFVLRRGEVHGLMGENGAGKSTLIKVLTGLYKRDAGEILYEGRPFELSSPVEAPKHGISTVYQEINLIPALSVTENIYLGRQPTRFGRIDWKTMHAGARAALKKLDVEVDVTQPVSSYSVAIQQLVAIARALDISAKVLIFDEPTSSLDTPEVEQLFSVIRKLKDDGMAILFVTHFIDQVYQISDRITVLRNGELVGEYQTAELPRVELVARMLGRQLAEFEIGKKKSATNGDQTGRKVFFQVHDMERKGAISAFDLEIREGEVLGLAGLLGSGRTEIARLLFGIDKAHSGKAELEGREVVLSSPRKAIAYGFGFCPEDRKAEGIIPDLTVRENIILALQAHRGTFKTLTKRQQDEIVDKYIGALEIKTPTAEQLVKNLSGGNQQKVIVARWLASNPRFLILDEPTRGIDVGTKAEIQRLVIDLSREGMAILFISSELEEVIRCSDRVAVLRDRQKIAELVGEQIEESQIMHTIASKEGAA
ncbi:ABC transporter related [Candidatus Vecturithrix granuli]|uniref:ABC transporter related n=1 Tax=Vecturithrix granuli TaxID=1499967 RepID=A0A0S6WAQ5_VECG1|nr:ABC transporter related [Candidatus Vecturithrix granuli]